MRSEIRSGLETERMKNGTTDSVDSNYRTCYIGGVLYSHSKTVTLKQGPFLHSRFSNGPEQTLRCRGFYGPVVLESSHLVAVV